MSDRHTGMDDWVVPSVLIGLSLGILLVVGLALAVSAEQRSAAPALIQELDAYTACLVDQGADVPRVEVGRDGGFGVVVPGSLVEGEFDEAAWIEAMDACAGMAPDVFGALLGRTLSDGFALIADPFDELDEVDALPFGWDEHPPETEDPRLGRAIRPPGDRSARCEQLRDARRERSGPRIDRLRKHCERFDR